MGGVRAKNSPNRLQFPADTAADPSPHKCGPSPLGLMENVVPDPGRPVEWCVCVCVFGGD